MKKASVYSAIILFLFSGYSPPSSAGPHQHDSLTLLYFFSASCPHCRVATPVVKELSKTFKVQGLIYGKAAPEDMPFEMRKGDKATAAKYGINGVPALVVLQNQSVKQVITGDRDIKDARVLLDAFRAGALSVTELLTGLPPSGPVTDADRTVVMVAGWVKVQGDYFSKNAQFMLTDKRQTVVVTAWLPKEAIKSRFKQTRPRLMSDVVGKPVVLRGRIVKSAGGVRFDVLEEKRVE